ncbi:DUF3228 family protein [bacterium]|nr:DUF3228 family protein [bacterium]
MTDSVPTVAWSDFARRRHAPGGRHTWFDGSEQDLLDLVGEHWAERSPGAGRQDLDQVVVVPVPPRGFHGTTVHATDETPLHAFLDRRQEGEEPFIRITAEGEPAPPRWAGVVLYSAETLEENDGVRSSDADWEVVCLLAGDGPDEPMDPVTMARNYLEKPGGTFAPYSAREFAEAIWHWSRRAPRHHLEDSP